MKDLQQNLLISKEKESMISAEYAGPMSHLEKQK